LRRLDFIVEGFFADEVAEGSVDFGINSRVER